MQLQRDSEVQRQSESEMDDGESTPAASAIVVVLKEEPPAESPPTIPGRPLRARASLPVYNISKLVGTDVHGRRRAKGDVVGHRKHRRVFPLDAPAGNNAGASSSTVNLTNEVVGDAINALNIDWSVGLPATPKGAKLAKKKSVGALSEAKAEVLTRRAARLSGTPVPSAVTSALTSIGKRGKKAAEDGLSRISRELRRLQDTKEFAHVDDRPIIQTVWSNGKFVDPRTLDQPAAEVRASKRAKTTHGTEPEVVAKAAPEAGAAVDAALAAVSEVALPQKKRITKKWLEKGLYAGQETPRDMSVGLTAAEKKKLTQYPTLLKVGEKVNKTLPPPMFNGLRLLLQGRDFKLPYDICNPLPPGHPKPPAYRTMTKNRFVGDAGAYWKKQPHLDDFQSKCVCKPEDGCAEDCQNRIMLYECDDTNCSVGRERCSNRAFTSLQERTKQGGRFRVGVEVFKTEGKGYGVRSNRCFRPHQIIMEYTGEIITERECERRMNEVYKDNECYYLMSFDQNMIIDATTGSIARFVNHSCSPNCRMIKWIVGGQPRMALFAGDRPIMTGEELTYDYNFDPFSAKNVQKCLCGADNCRGFLGPKPREVKAPKVAPPSKEETKKASAKAASKRKLQELIDDDDDIYDIEASAKSIKKRKIAVAKGAASSLSKSGLKVAKGAASALKRSMSSISVSAKAALGGGSKKNKISSPASQRRVSTGGIVKKTSPGKKAKATTAAAENAKITTTKAALSALIASGLPTKKSAAANVALAQASRSSSASLTIVAAPPQPKALTTTTGNAKSKPAAKKTTPTKRTPPKSKARKQQHSGYTPPSSPGPDDGKQAKTSAGRKKLPAGRRILEGKAAGTASVTKPKAKPKAKAKSAVAAVAKRGGFMAAVRKAIGKSAGVSAAAPAPEEEEEDEVAEEEMEVEVEKDESPAAEASIKAAPARFYASIPLRNDVGRRPQPQQEEREEREDSPEREPREGMDVPRVDAQIRLVEG